MCVTFIVSALPNEIYHSTKMDHGNESIRMFVIYTYAHASMKRMKFSSLISRKSLLPFKHLFARFPHSYYFINRIKKQFSRLRALVGQANSFQIFISNRCCYLRFRENIFSIFSRKHFLLIFYYVFIIIYSVVILLYDIAINCQQVPARFLRRCKLNFVGIRDITLKLTETCK